MYSWGWGLHGNLGHGNTETLHDPTLIEALKAEVIVSMAGGTMHSVFLNKQVIYLVKY